MPPAYHTQALRNTKDRMAESPGDDLLSAPTEKTDSTPRKPRHEATAPAEKTEPMDPIENTEPIENAESTEPILQNEFTDPMLRIEPRDPMLFTLRLVWSWVCER